MARIGTRWNTKCYCGHSFDSHLIGPRSVPIDERHQITCGALIVHPSESEVPI